MTSCEPSNADRAEWAKAALAIFTSETYSGDHPDTMDRGDLESAIGDLIADLLHLAVRGGMDATAIHDHARSMFEQELAEETNSKACRADADANGTGGNHD